MRVLIIEDDEDKLRDLSDWVSSTFSSATVLEARSLHTGKSAALDLTVDLILLDMTMKNYERSLEEEGGRPHAFAGREILRRMHRERITTPVVVVTQFDRFGDEDDYRTLAELKNELSSRFPNYLGTVHYRANVDDWRSILNGVVAAVHHLKG